MDQQETDHEENLPFVTICFTEGQFYAMVNAVGHGMPETIKECEKHGYPVQYLKEIADIIRSILADIDEITRDDISPTAIN